MPDEEKLRTAQDLRKALEDYRRAFGDNALKAKLRVEILKAKQERASAPPGRPH